MITMKQNIFVHCHEVFWLPGPCLGSRQRKYFSLLTAEISPFSELISRSWTVNYLSKSMGNKYVILLPTQLHLSPMKPGNEFLLLLKGLRLLNNSEASLLAVVGCVALNYLEVLFVRNWAILVIPLSSGQMSITWMKSRWMPLFVKLWQQLKNKFFVLGMIRTMGSLGISFLDHSRSWRALGTILLGRSCKCAVLAQNICILSVGNN